VLLVHYEILLYHWAMKDIMKKRFALIPEGERGREV
jgi:hypothetical protein